MAADPPACIRNRKPNLVTACSLVVQDWGCDGERKGLQGSNSKGRNRLKKPMGTPDCFQALFTILPKESQRRSAPAFCILRCGLLVAREWSLRLIMNRKTVNPQPGTNNHQAVIEGKVNPRSAGGLTASDVSGMPGAWLGGKSGLLKKHRR